MIDYLIDDFCSKPKWSEALSDVEERVLGASLPLLSVW